MNRVWRYKRGDWEWSPGTWPRSYFRCVAFGCDEFFRRTVVIRVPFVGAVVVAFTGKHPEWMDDFSSGEVGNQK